MTSDLPRFSSSEEVAFKTCRLAHHFRYDLGYAPVLTNRKLSVGIGFHLGMEAYYRGDDWPTIRQATDLWADGRWEEIVAAGLDGDAETRLDFINDRDLVFAMVEGYIDWAEKESDDGDYEVVSVEEAIYVEVPGAPCVMPVKLDLLQRHRQSGRLRIVDFKTAKYLTKDATKYQLSEQNGNYSLAILAAYGERPTELAYREARKVIPGGRTKPPYFQQIPVRLTKAEMLHRASEYAATARERFDPHRVIYRNPSACCGSWKNDWQAPCLKVSQGLGALEALEESGKYGPCDSYQRYSETEET